MLRDGPITKPFVPVGSRQSAVGSRKPHGPRREDTNTLADRKDWLGGRQLALVLVLVSVGLLAFSSLVSSAEGPQKTRKTRKKASQPISSRLRSLGKRSGAGKVSAKTLLELRRQAESLKDPEQRGRAYFLLGYREYEAAQYPAAVKDLQTAAATKFILEDYAEFYRAAAAVQGHEPTEALAPLDGFAARYPESPLRHQALALLAQAAIDAGQPDRAIQTLATDSRLHQDPAHLLLLAEAQAKAKKWEEAARTDQEIYYKHPASPEAGAAQELLAQVKQHLGTGFPAASETMQAGRPEALYRHARYQEALREYEALASQRPPSPRAELWQVRRAQCMLQLKQAHEAAEALEGARLSQPEADAERLAALADAYERLNDATALARTLDELSARHPQSPLRASALSAAAGFFARQGNWATAARYDQDLAAAFPDSSSGRDASWRAAWMAYLEKELDRAKQDFTDYVTRYPTSAQNATAIYWLGRLEEERGENAEARSFYQLVRQRFTQGYYAGEAGERLKRLKGHQDATAGPAGDSGREAALPSRLAETLSPPASTGALCAVVAGASSDAPAWRDRFQTLHALNLNSLAESYLRAMLAERPTSAELRYAFSRFEAEQGDTQEAIYAARDLEPDYSDFRFEALPEEIWALLYPRPYWGIVKQQARANGLDPYLVMGLIRQESGFDPHATSRANARGLMQMLPGTAVLESPLVASGQIKPGKPGVRSRKGRPSKQVVARQLYDPAYNIRLSCRFLRGLIKEFHGNLGEAMAAYNAGDFRVKEWLARGFPDDAEEFVETIPFGETRIYVKAVLRDAAIYRGLLAASPRFKKCG